MKNISAALITCLIISLFSSKSWAQTSNSDTKSDSLARELVERYKKVNATKMSMTGFRIQIYFGSERSKATEIRADFSKNFPEISSYLIYQQPYFKIRVGDFKTRIEASGFLKKLEDHYTTAFIVPDEVKLPGSDQEK
jgi:hypothetical protein